MKSAQIAQPSPAPRHAVDWYLYKGRMGRTPIRNGKQCEGSVWVALGNWGEHYQCRATGKHEWMGHRWCGRHHPPTVEAREQKREAERRAEHAASRARWDAGQAIERQKEAALEAIRKIAAGHNDPRGLALEVLKDPTL